MKLFCAQYLADDPRHPSQRPPQRSVGRGQEAAVPGVQGGGQIRGQEMRDQIVRAHPLKGPGMAEIDAAAAVHSV